MIITSFVISVNTKWLILGLFEIIIRKIAGGYGLWEDSPPARAIKCGAIAPQGTFHTIHKANFCSNFIIPPTTILESCYLNQPLLLYLDDDKV